MKFLVDNQLPLALAKYVQQRGFDCEHVLDVGLAECLDVEICRYAEAHDRVIISKDEDFFYIASQSKRKIKLIWVRLGNCRTAPLLAAFDRLWPSIEASLNAGDRLVEIR